MTNEKPLSMKQAAAWLESEMGIKRSPITVWGWGYYGASGAKLEMVSIAGRWHVTPSALKRFFSNCTRVQGQLADVAELRL